MARKPSTALVPGIPVVASDKSRRATPAIRIEERNESGELATRYGPRTTGEGAVTVDPTIERAKLRLSQIEEDAKRDSDDLVQALGHPWIDNRTGQSTLPIERGLLTQVAIELRLRAEPEVSAGLRAKAAQSKARATERHQERNAAIVAEWSKHREEFTRLSDSRRAQLVAEKFPRKNGRPLTATQMLKIIPRELRHPQRGPTTRSRNSTP